MLAIFDLDDTLIRGDSSNLFTRFLHQKGLTNGKDPEARDNQYLEAYAAGSLRLDEYMEFSLEPLKGWTSTEILSIVDEFIETVITPRVCETMQQRIQWHKAQGHSLLVISASGDHLVGPISQSLGIADSLGIELVWNDGKLTGTIGARRPFRKGKVDELESWKLASGTSFEEIWFYSDSHNDLPLLEVADHPVAVCPDPHLAAHAREHGWQIIRRNPER